MLATVGMINHCIRLQAWRLLYGASSIGGLGYLIFNRPRFELLILLHPTVVFQKVMVSCARIKQFGLVAPLLLSLVRGYPTAGLPAHPEAPATPPR